MNAENADTLVLIAHHLPVEMHHHHAVQLVVSLDKPYPAILDGQRQENIQGFVIDANIPHSCQSNESTVLVISIDANTAKGKALKQRLSGRNFALLDELMDPEAVQRFSTSYWQQGNANASPFDPLALVYPLLDVIQPLPEPDRRVIAAREFVVQHIEATLRLEEIAAAVALSESRLRHLFVCDTGITITTYILWCRMKVALNALIKQDMSLSEAAHHAGYADHAHFTRTFRRMFGVSPSLILKYSQFLQVFESR